MHTYRHGACNKRREAGIKPRSLNTVYATEHESPKHALDLPIPYTLYTHSGTLGCCALPGDFLLIVVVGFMVLPRASRSSSTMANRRTACTQSSSSSGLAALNMKDLWWPG